MSFRLLVLSDLHLGEAHNDTRYAVFLEILKKFEHSEENELLLMGDIFDILIGNKKFWKNIHPEFFASLERAIKNGKKVTWIQGNHDFQLAKLVRPLGIHWIENEEVLVREGVKIYVSHGDQADRSNRLHLLLRRFLNSWFLEAFIWLIPERLGEKVIYPYTLKLSGASRQASRQRDSVDQARNSFRAHAQRLARESQANLVLLGHSHISDNVALAEQARYLNYGSWYEDPQVGILQITGSAFESKVFKASSWLLDTSKQ